ncbi:MAG: prolyl oligopeptidase family serine peptidase [Pseudomonadota bacterium]
MASTTPFPELETDEAQIAEFVARENARTVEALHDATHHADVARIKAILEDDSALRSVRRRGSWVYNYLQNANHPKGLWRRLPDGEKLSVEADWQPVFDLDAFCAETGEDWHWRGAETCPLDPERILIALSWQGSDQTRYIEWDLQNEKPVQGGFDLGPERNAASWLDKDTLLYSTATGDGAATRSGWPGRVVRLPRGGAIEAAELVFQADHEDLLAYAGVYLTADGGTCISLTRIVAIGDAETTLYLDGLNGPSTPLPTPKDCAASYNTTHYAYVTAHDGEEPAGTLLLHRIGSDQGRVLFRPAPYVSVDASSVFFVHERMFWIETDKTEPRLRTLDLTDNNAEPVTLALPGDPQSAWFFPYDEHSTQDGPYLLGTSGFLVPQTTWLSDLTGSRLNATQIMAEPTYFDANGMEVRMHSAISADGAEVPYHIVLPRDQAGPVPVLQYGYGGFGVSLGPYYSAVYGATWLERGGALVQAYIRGGAEFGSSWHHVAKREGRKKSFEDFAAIAADLVKRGYSTVEQIACNGGSNGGLLCSVMLTRYPDHFGAVWAEVPVTDMVRFHQFPAGAAWIDEYGDPDQQGDREMLLTYSPLHNVASAEERRYPPMLLTTSDSDDRVDPSHTRRFAAALLDAGQPCHFHSKSGGHGGGGSTAEKAEEAALGVAFLRKMLGGAS